MFELSNDKGLSLLKPLQKYFFFYYNLLTVQVSYYIITSAFLFLGTKSTNILNYVYDARLRMFVYEIILFVMYLNFRKHFKTNVAMYLTMLTK